MTPRELQSDRATGVQSPFQCIFCNRGGFGSKKAVRIHVQRVRACRKMHGRLHRVLNKSRKVSRALAKLFHQTKSLTLRQVPEMKVARRPTSENSTSIPDEDPDCDDIEMSDGRMSTTSQQDVEN